jgi:hypothetical protein
MPVCPPDPSVLRLPSLPVLIKVISAPAPLSVTLTEKHMNKRWLTLLVRTLRSENTSVGIEGRYGDLKSICAAAKIIKKNYL